MERRRVDRGLEPEPEEGVGEEEPQRPLVLLVASGRAEGEPGLAFEKCERRAQGCARSLAALYVIGVIGVEVEHLCAGTQAEAETVDDGRALQPTSTRRAGDQVAVPVGDGDVAGVA